MKSYDSMTAALDQDDVDAANSASDGVDRSRKPVVSLIVAAVIAILVLTITGSGAQEDPLSLSGTEDPEALEDLVELVQSQYDQIQALEEQLAFARQAVIQSEGRIDVERATILDFQGSGIRSAAEQVASMEDWRVGYRLGGGNSLSQFENTILPCESGSQPDPFAAVGPTDDWGRAQINRPVWGSRFEQLTGMEFETGILDPLLNGYMAAIVEREHATGLSAWTCWRNRR